VTERIERHGVSHLVSISGNPSWSFVSFKDVGPYAQWQIKTLFLQEMFSRGVLTFGTHNMSYSHSDNDIRQLMAVYDEVFPILKDAADNLKLDDCLRCEPLEPLFKVR